MEHQSNQCSRTRVRLVVSYGGKLVRKTPRDSLFYAGGKIKILVVDRNMKYLDIVTVLTFSCDLKTPCKFKYLSPGDKDLDELVSVVCDEDVENMMDEYNKIYLSTTKMPERMRLFVLEPTTKSQCVPLQRSDSSNPDYLFGLDKKSDPHAAPVELHVPEFPDKRDFGLNLDDVKEKQVIDQKEKQVEEKKQVTTDETRGIIKTKPCDNNVTSVPTSPEFPDKRDFGLNLDAEKEKQVINQEKQVEEKKQVTIDETRGIMKTKPCDNNVTSVPTSTFAYTAQTLPLPPMPPLIYWAPGYTVVHQTTYVPSWCCYVQPGTHSVMTLLPNLC